MEITVTVNGTGHRAQKGETLLTVLRRAGLRVPTLCSMEGLSPSGACRLCVVEVEGLDRLVPSCSFSLEGPISVTSHSPRVMKARRTNVELLLSNHPDDCLYCDRNGTCELQALAEEMNIRRRQLPGTKRHLPRDQSDPAVVRDPSKCILCGRCVRVCEEIMNTSTFDFAFRGNEMRISTTLGQPVQFSNCTSCGQCLVSCPTAALTEKSALEQLLDFLNDPGKEVAVQFTPASAASVSSMMDIKPGKALPDFFRGLLYRCGFDRVFETTTGTALMIMELARLLETRGPLHGEWPLISASCPAWVRYLEQTDPELTAALVPLLSPQQVMGRVIREYHMTGTGGSPRELVSVLVTSCTAAKREALEERNTWEGKPVIDLVISAREVIRLVAMLGIDPGSVHPDPEASLLLPAGATGRMSALAGGESEAVMRLLHLMKTGKHLNLKKFHRFRMQRPYREMLLESDGGGYRTGAVSGLSNAAGLIGELKEGKVQLDYLEVMACPNGCINGGGQPVPAAGGNAALWNRSLQEMDGGPRSSFPFPIQKLRELQRQLTDATGQEGMNRLLYGERR